MDIKDIQTQNIANEQQVHLFPFTSFFVILLLHEVDNFVIKFSVFTVAERILLAIHSLVRMLQVANLKFNVFLIS